MNLCPYCGELETLEVSEVWEREFTVSACCEVAEQWAQIEMQAADRDDWRALFADAGLEVANVLDASVIDFGLSIVPVEWATVREFIAQHHRHNAPPRGWKFGAGVVNGSDLVAVMSAGRPVARMIDARTTLEINRVCVRDDLQHRGLAQNACSMLYGYACREAKRLGYERVITYTLESEHGASLRAANFRPEARTKAESWNREHRPRNAAPIARKVRWSRRVNGREPQRSLFA